VLALRTISVQLFTQLMKGFRYQDQPRISSAAEITPSAISASFLFLRVASLRRRRGDRRWNR
jgi:hypothetical protein